MTPQATGSIKGKPVIDFTAPRLHALGPRGLLSHVGCYRIIREDAYARAVLPQMRQVILRTTFVLGRGGGALPRLARLVRWGLGGTVGHGRQGISWIHEQDMNQLLVRAILNHGMKGAYLATAPNPVSNAEFMRELRQVLRAPFGLPAANWMVRLGAPLIMRTDPELAIYGRYCVSRRLREEGFDFMFPDLASALRDLYPSKLDWQSTSEGEVIVHG